MKKIILSADSTCDLGDELKARYDVHYYPFHVILEGTDYQDNVDIHVKEIFDAYYARKALPQTAAINMGEYITYFEGWVKEGYDVIHLNLGGAISAAHHNCVLAAEELNAKYEGKIYPIDSFNLSTGISLLIIEAAERIQAGMDAAQIAKEVEDLRGKVHSSFILDTLDFMRAGGRCSTIAAIGANLLNLKPCIEVDNADGSMHVGKKYRGNLQKVLPQYVRDKLAEYPHLKLDHIFITYSSIEPELAKLVRKTILATADFKEIHETVASCTIACHCGPGTLGILFETE